MDTAFYHIIRHADGRGFYDGAALTLADAQILVNDAITRGELEVGSFLRIDDDLLVIEAETAG